MREWGREWEAPGPETETAHSEWDSDYADQTLATGEGASDLFSDEEEEAADTDEDDLPVLDVFGPGRRRRSNSYIDVWSATPVCQHTAVNVADVHSKPQ